MSAHLHRMSNFEHWLLTLTSATALIGPICAQTAEREATLTGLGGNDAGKCTIEFTQTAPRMLKSRAAADAVRAAGAMAAV
jgi:hypothetical protein